jgi:hypothetical protein
MIVVRDIFELHFGRAREAIELGKELEEIERQSGQTRRGRVLTDVTGRYYTMVVESEYESLAEYEERQNTEMGAREWKEWYGRFVPLVQEGRREILRVVG